jgi:hypothetical protein
MISNLVPCQHKLSEAHIDLGINAMILIYFFKGALIVNGK